MSTRKKEGLPPVMKVNAAKGLLINTIYLCSAIEQKTIPLSTFNANLIFAPNNEQIFISPIYTERIVGALNEMQMYIHRKRADEADLDNFRNNLLACVMGNCSIILDEALDGKFGDKPKQFSDSDLDQLRAIIYMMRCAFAHTPTLPRWDIRQGSKYDKEFHIKEINMTIDGRKLDGKKLSIKDHGGMVGYLTLMELCARFIKKSG